MLGKTERMGKFGKISLMIYRNLSCAVIWIEFFTTKNTCYDSRLRHSSFKSSTCLKNLQILNNSQKYFS